MLNYDGAIVYIAVCLMSVAMNVRVIYNFLGQKGWITIPERRGAGFTSLI